MGHNYELIPLMDPSGEVESRPKEQIAKRLRNIEGICIGLLSNQKPNVDPLLDELGRILTDEHRVGKIVKRVKASQSEPAEENIINALAACDGIIHGVGD